MNKGNLETAPTERIQRLVKEEMDVCCEAAGRYPSNYNAWSHRAWVLQHLAKLSGKVCHSREKYLVRAIGKNWNDFLINTLNYLE